MLLLRRTILPRPWARSLATSARPSTFTPLLINGERRAASDGRTFEVYNPADNQVVGTAASASSSDCIAAIGAAATAHPEWESTPVTTRASILLNVASELEKLKSEVIETLNAETATTSAWAEGNLMGALHTLRTAAGMSTELIGRAYPSALAPGGQVIEQKRALGVVFSIAPWNAPIVLSVRAIAIPLLCGNSVVFKGSEYSPASQSIITDAFVKAGAPPGTISFLSTSAQDAPARCAEIIAHPSVRKITFTGSDTVGRALAIECAKHLKPAVLELGGKSAAVVLTDADIEHAAQTIVFGALLHSGQICMSTERVIVEKSVAGKLRDAIKALVERVPVAPEEGEGAPVKHVAPLFKEQAAENVIKAIKEAQSQGATVLVGNSERQGASIRPHLLTNVPLGSTLWKRETFGPVISFVEADNIKHAIELANSSDYTLTAALFTQNVSTALQVASAIRAGATIVNGSTFHPEPTNTEIGLGGSSGYGRFDVDGFTDRRTIVIYPNPSK